MKGSDLLALAGKHRIAVGAAVIAAAGAIYALLHLADLMKWIEERPGLAAWVQAVFSVVAIFVAIWTAQSATREARRKADEERLDDFEAIAGLAGHAVNLIESAYQRSAQSRSLRAIGSVDRHSLASIRDAQRALAEIPVLSIPGGATTVSNVLAIRRLLAEAEATLEPDHFGRPEMPSRLYRLFERAQKHAEWIGEAAATARKRS